jgi:PAS domain S-box-containing protein
MAEAHRSCRSEPRAFRPEDHRRPSLAEITTLPAKRSDDLAPSRISRSSQASEARIAELEAEVRALRERDARVRLILDSAADYAIITMDNEGCITSWNAGAQNIMGYAEAEILGRSGDIVFTSEDRACGKFAAELRRAVETGRASNERWHLRRDGTRFWASGMMMPLLDAAGHPQGFLNILRDRTEDRAAAERRELLMAEMDHRIKNTFAIVQAVAAQTYRHAATVAEFQEGFGARLAVLARSNDVLIGADWHDAPLQDVIEGALDAYGGEPGRITAKGPPVLLAASLAMTVSLAFHELATNAVKYGALSVPAGRVDVSWTTSQTRKGARKVEVIWRERGGPVVNRPQRRGFGSQLLEKGLPSGGTVKLDFQPEGLECRICLPLSSPTNQEMTP